MIKAAFLDYDWTLYSHKTRQIPPSAVKAIRQLQAQGILVFLCSGRTKAALAWFDDGDLEFDGYILCNGQFIYDSHYQLIYKDYFSGAAKAYLTQLYQQKTIPIIFGNEEQIIMNYITDFILTTQAAAGRLDPDIKPYEGEEFGIAHLYFEKEEDRRFLEPIRSEISITGWNQYCADIMPKGASKARAIEFVEQLYHIDPSQTIGFGDGNNDLEMLQHCQIAVAMGNAVNVIKEVSDYITADIDQDGLALALQHFQLI